jgi:hypothetical protein
MTFRNFWTISKGREVECVVMFHAPNCLSGSRFCTVLIITAVKYARNIMLSR